MTLSGERVRRILEQAVDNAYTRDPVRKVGGTIQVSGVTSTYDPSRRAGDCVLRVEVNGVPLDPERPYAVTTNSMLADAGQTYPTFTEGRERREHASRYEMVRSRITERDRAVTPSDQRITRLPGVGAGVRNAK